MNRQNTIFSIIIVIAIIIGGLFIYSQKVQAPQDSSQDVGTSIAVTSTTTSTTYISSDWKTYTIAQVGITFKAPADFVPQASNSGFELLIPTATSSPYFHTHLIEEAYLKATAPAATCPTTQGSITASSTVTINGISFTRQVWNGVGAGNLYQGINYVTTRNGLCYEATLYTHSTVSEGFYTGDQNQIATVDAQQAQDIANVTKIFDQITSSITFAPDVYPLYSGLQWNNPIASSQNFGAIVIKGTEFDSSAVQNVTDITQKTTAFKQYYDTKLKAAGWKLDPSLQADGAGSSEWVYTKGNTYIALSYSSQAMNQNQSGPLSCPCSLTFKIFEGEGQ